MRARVGAALALGAAALAVLAITLGGGDEPYRMRLVLENANGLRAGSDVRIADVAAGQVASVSLGPRDDVVAELELDADQAPVGRDASVGISSLNLLGHKYVALEKGDVQRPAPSGFTIPRSRISTSTDLDQLLDVLDADTRARLTILINEAGRAMTGRRDDFNALLRELPHTAVAGTRLLEQFVSDTRALSHLVHRSDKFIGQITRERRSLSRMVATVGEMSTTFAGRRTELRQTLARAPGMLRALQHFLADLRSTTVPLGPAARNITATAPALTSTLAEVEPFRRAAEPALVQARRTAPALTRLARGATPVVRRANPALRSLATLGRALVPLTDTLDRSAYNLLAVVHNWARAIQFRDGVGHVFNAAVTITPETLHEMVRRLTGNDPETKRQREPSKRSEEPARPAPSRREDGAPPQARGVTPERPADPAQPRSGQGSNTVSEVLDFLLRP